MCKQFRNEAVLQRASSVSFIIIAFLLNITGNCCIVITVHLEPRNTYILWCAAVSFGNRRTLPPMEVEK